MTTKMAARRLTHQPQSVEGQDYLVSNFAEKQPVEDVRGVYERHGSPQKTAMQVFNEHQRLTCARLSVPHERRRRDRFDGTQNSFFFQTASAGQNDRVEANDASRN